ncbi:MAG: AMP-binding protein [Candidatus Aenigmatarchaeota archaeon]
MRYWNEKIEKMPRNELNKLINKKTRYTVRYAYEFSPFYHKLFDEIKIKPDDIKTPEDVLKKVPVITRREIVENQPPFADNFYMFSAPPGTGYTRPYTSGSTGLPKICRRTFDDWEMSREACARAYTAAGIDKDDIVLDILPFGINVSGLASLFGFYRTVGAEVITAGISDQPSQVELIKIHKPTVIFGMPCYVDRLSRKLELAGMNPKSLGIKKILLVGEASTEEKRNKIAEAYNAEVYDIYASDEGDLMAFQCTPNQSDGKTDVGLHVNEDLSLLYAVDLESKSFLCEGETGSDWLVTLVEPGRYKGMVLLGYSHGDRFAIQSEERCEVCCRTLKRITHPTREKDELRLGPVRIDLSEFEIAVNRPKVRKYLTGEWEVEKWFDENEKMYHVILPSSTIFTSKDVPPYVKEEIKSFLFRAHYPLYAVTRPGQEIATFDVKIVDEGNLEIYSKRGKSTSQRVIDKSKKIEN